MRKIGFLGGATINKVVDTSKWEFEVRLSEHQPRGDHHINFEVHTRNKTAKKEEMTRFQYENKEMSDNKLTNSNGSTITRYSTPIATVKKIKGKWKIYGE